TVAAKLDRRDQRAADEAEVAVGVADAEPERSPGRDAPHVSDGGSNRAVGARGLVALDDVDVPSSQLCEPDELAGVGLSVAVGVEEPVPAGPRQRRRHGAQGSAVAAIALVLDHAQPRFALAHVAKARARFVARAVVDDDDLAVRTETVECLAGRVDETADCRRVVVTEQAGRDRVGPVQLSAWHIRSISSWVSSGEQGRLTHSHAHSRARGVCSRRKLAYAGWSTTARG